MKIKLDLSGYLEKGGSYLRFRQFSVVKYFANIIRIAIRKKHYIKDIKHFKIWTRKCTVKLQVMISNEITTSLLKKLRPLYVSNITSTMQFDHIISKIDS